MGSRVRSQAGRTLDSGQVTPAEPVPISVADEQCASERQPQPFDVPASALVPVGQWQEKCEELRIYNQRGADDVPITSVASRAPTRLHLYDDAFRIVKGIDLV